MQAAPMITDAQRRETLLELMEASLRPKSAAPNLGMDLVEPMKPSYKQEACHAQVIMIVSALAFRYHEAYQHVIRYMQVSCEAS